jgi:hypothetical protein
MLLRVCSGIDDEASDEIVVEREPVARVDRAAGGVAFEVVRGDVVGRVGRRGTGAPGGGGGALPDQPRPARVRSGDR